MSVRLSSEIADSTHSRLVKLAERLKTTIGAIITYSVRKAIPDLERCCENRPAGLRRDPRRDRK